MTVSTTSNSVTHPGNGAATVFDFDFPIPSPASNVVVYLTDEDNENTTVNPALYTITGLDDPDGGAITYPLAGDPIAEGTSITISRELPIVQETSLLNQGGYYPRSVEDALDYLTMLIQQQGSEVERAIKLPVTVDLDLVSPILEHPQALTLLGWNSTGTRLINYDLVNVEIMVPGPDTVGTEQLQDGAVTLVKLAQDVLDYIADAISTAIADALAGIAGVSTGDIVMSGLGAKTGYLLCNGAAVSRATYDDLFDAVGTTFGAGNGTTTFNVPNLVDKSAMGAGGAVVALGALAGALTTTLTAAQSGLVGHTHTATTDADAADADIPTKTAGSGITGPETIASILEEADAMVDVELDITGITTTVDAVASAPAAEAHSNLHPVQGVNFFIKT